MLFQWLDKLKREKTSMIEDNVISLRMLQFI